KFKHVLQQLDDVEHLSSAVSEQVSQGVVFLLRPSDPGLAVKSQPALRPRRDPPELWPRPMNKHGPEAADFTVSTNAAAHVTPEIPWPTPRPMTLMGVSPIPARLRIRHAGRRSVVSVWYRTGYGPVTRKPVTTSGCSSEVPELPFPDCPNGLAA